MTRRDREPLRISFRGWFWIGYTAAIIVALICLAAAVFGWFSPPAAGLVPGAHVQLPPAHYQGDAVTAVNFTSDPNRACVRMGAPRRSMACYGRGVMVLPNPCLPVYRGERFAEIACHELGHRNSWPADHRVFQ